MKVFIDSAVQTVWRFEFEGAKVEVTLCKAAGTRSARRYERGGWIPVGGIARAMLIACVEAKPKELAA